MTTVSRVRAILNKLFSLRTIWLQRSTTVPFKGNMTFVFVIVSYILTLTRIFLTSV